jgi:hypothetical protein
LEAATHAGEPVMGSASIRIPGALDLSAAADLVRFSGGSAGRLSKFSTGGRDGAVAATSVETGMVTMAATADQVLASE